MSQLIRRQPLAAKTHAFRPRRLPKNLTLPKKLPTAETVVTTENHLPYQSRPSLYPNFRLWTLDFGPSPQPPALAPSTARGAGLAVYSTNAARKPAYCPN